MHSIPNPRIRIPDESTDLEHQQPNNQPVASPAPAEIMGKMTQHLKRTTTKSEFSKKKENRFEEMGE